MNDNPLLENKKLPRFAHILPEHVEPALDQILTENRAGIKKILHHRHQAYTWDNLMQPLEAMGDRLNAMWSPVGHMNAVINSEELREVYNRCIAKISEYATELGQNSELYNAIKSIKEGPEFDDLNEAQQKIINNELRDFHLAGVALADDKKSQFMELRKRLSQLTSQFEDNLLDATNAWTKHFTSKTELAGIPEHALALMKAAAHQKGLSGYLLTLDLPCYIATMENADSRELRQEIYTAYVTRASELGPQAGRFDNSEIMQDILICRHELAQLLDFENYAEYSLATKMAKDPQEVLDFLSDLAVRCKSIAKKEFAELQAFAEETDELSDLQPWDIAYYSEKLRKQTFKFSQEDLRPYFSEEHVLNGLFTIVNKLYDIQIEEVKGVETWHKDVRFFSIIDSEGLLRGKFYLDLYARSHKRGGAWMDECRSRRRIEEHLLQTPVAYLTCNFAGPVDDKPALFTHEEVMTLFHEFGHGLHHMLTLVDHTEVSGINGVPWDAVELPSQFLENWCWEKDAIDLFAGHFETGEPLPDKLFDKMLAAKNFQSAMQMLRQIEFSLFDFRMHYEYNPEKTDFIQSILDEVRQNIAVVPVVDFNRFQNGFSHVFAGGYAAGYYSYKWAEVLSSDAYSKFEETGIFNPQTGAEFLHHILEQGGTREPMELFIAFRGRKPTIDALLRHSGIS